MAETLLPCPFCGGVHVEIVNLGSRPDDPHVVQCDDCDASVSGMSACEAIAAWNRRAGRTCRKVPGRMKYGRRMPKCSECGQSLGDERWVYCPSCGARTVSER